jgi:hypothetical protein
MLAWLTDFFGDVGTQGKNPVTCINVGIFSLLYRILVTMLYHCRIFSLLYRILVTLLYHLWESSSFYTEYW